MICFRKENAHPNLRHTVEVYPSLPLGLQTLVNIELVLKSSIFIVSNTLEGFSFITALVNSSRCVAGTAASLTLHSEYLRIAHVQHKYILVYIMNTCKGEMCYTTPHLANIYKSGQNSEKQTLN